ncbi:hypothetical protein D3C85_1820970 [compost metagenome]
MSADAGISSLWFGPTSFLAIWGLIIPTKKKLPPSATVPEDKATAARDSPINSRCTATPKPVAVVGPKFKVLSTGDLYIT